MTALVFVDANVFLYAHHANEPAKQARARAWLEHLWRTGAGRTSMQVLSEYYVNLKRKEFSGLSPEGAWDYVAALLAWTPRAVDEQVFVRAHAIEARHRISWWDSMIVAAAQLQECELLLTEGLQDRGAYGTVTACSPFTLEAGEPSAAYEAGARLPNPHRPRGRPRRKLREAPAARL
ncbi:MAG TPA: PIN domain-containing protein [Burkholderiales bacterium]|nr:PIN domain-containing protein [Burkholderiales bacterium]